MGEPEDLGGGDKGDLSSRMVDDCFLPMSLGAPVSRQPTGRKPQFFIRKARLISKGRHGPNGLAEVLAPVASQEKLSLRRCSAHYTHCREQAPFRALLLGEILLTSISLWSPTDEH